VTTTIGLAKCERFSLSASDMAKLLGISERHLWWICRSSMLDIVFLLASSV